MEAQLTLNKVLLTRNFGELNPADLLTKFIVGKDKVDQLVSLYGLVFMEGRAASAPLLKKKTVPTKSDVVEVNIVKDSDLMGDIVVPEADLHDVTRWPHSYTEEEMGRMFPTAVAAPETETISEEELQEHGRLHRRWAAVRITCSRG